MQNDANPKCLLCHGEGEVWLYAKSDKRKEVYSDWIYCDGCFPHNRSLPWFIESMNFWYISFSEYEELLKQGYKEIDN